MGEEGGGLRHEAPGQGLSVFSVTTLGQRVLNVKATPENPWHLPGGGVSWAGMPVPKAHTDAETRHITPRFYLTLPALHAALCRTCPSPRLPGPCAWEAGLGRGAEPSAIALEMGSLGHPGS